MYSINRKTATKILLSRIRETAAISNQKATAGIAQTDDDSPFAYHWSS